MIVKLIDLPYHVKGFVSRVDGEDIIILNSRLSHEANVETYKHELEHIAQNDLTSDCEVNVIECIRHK